MGERLLLSGQARPSKLKEDSAKGKEKRSVMEKASVARGEKSQHGGSYSDRSGKGQVHMAGGGVLFWFPWEARYRCGRMCMVHLQTSHGIGHVILDPGTPTVRWKVETG